MKRAVVLVNLGTTDTPTTAGVRRFLREFLSDRRVVEVPRLIWLPILYLFILPFRSPRVAKKYQQLWLGDDSPLRFMSQSLTSALQKQLDSYYGDRAPALRLAMTYGSPNVAEVLHDLNSEGVDDILLLPLFPQYSATTTAAVFDRAVKAFSEMRNIPGWQWVKDYHDHPLYIRALAQQVQTHWQNSGRGDKLLMSFHGIPLRNVELGDPYRAQCETTAALVAQELGLEEGQWMTSYQSRLGKAQWLEPYTDKVVAELAQNNVASLDVICPAFATECLETLEEIDDEAAEIFYKNGGERFNYIPCLNDSESHQQLLLQLIREKFQD